MKRLVFLAAGLMIVLAAGSAPAYNQYSQNGGDSTNCGSCHGDFTAAPYTSLSDGQDWGNDLHDLHRGAMLNADCDACHGSGAKFPVLLSQSAGGTGLNALSCVGCHGRSEDESPPSAGYGAGLRQHHHNAGIAICASCHQDADPANYTPVGEDVLPDYYANPGTGHPNIPPDSCTPAGVEDFAGSTQGLDNDGDGVYDLADTDCELLSLTPSSLDFGSVPTGTASSRRIVTMTNGFRADIHVSTISLSGADAGEFSFDAGSGSSGTCGPPPVTLAAAAGCTVSVSFSPGVDGARSASLDVASDGGNAAVGLSGTGQAAGGGNTAPTAPSLVAPGDGSTVAGPDVTFGWNRSTDPDGDTVTYDLFLCEGDASFAAPCDIPRNGTPIASASVGSRVSFLAGTGMGLFLMGIALAGGLSRRRKLALILAVLLMAGMFIAACGGGGGGTAPPVPAGELTFDELGLNNSTTYYWKVVASDGTDSTSSPAWSFDTQ